MAGAIDYRREIRLPNHVLRFVEVIILAALFFFGFNGSSSFQVRRCDAEAASTQEAASMGALAQAAGAKPDGGQQGASAPQESPEDGGEENALEQEPMRITPQVVPIRDAGPAISGVRPAGPDPRVNEAMEEAELGAGRWRKRQDGSGLTLSAAQQEVIAQLEAIGYTSGSINAPASSGVTLNDVSSACKGWNFYTSGHKSVAALMDMEGKVVHQWTKDFWEIWPEYATKRDNENTQYWRRAYLYPNGDILVIFEGLGIAKLNKDSRLIWSNPCYAHHDLEVMPSGEIYVLTRKAHLNPEVNKQTPILEDYVTILNPDGSEKKSVSLWKCFENSAEYREIWLRSHKRARDIFHTNTLEVLKGTIADRAPAFKAGNILTSMLVLSAIAVVDLEREEVVWAYQGPFKAQHDPQLLEDGNILLFDNRGRGSQSSILEFDPVSKEMKWFYRGTKDHPFYSHSCGTAQRLPNGNTLITESDPGRAFEVTPAGKTVWEFYNPNRAGERGEYIATLFEMLRLPPDFPVDWASNPS